MTSSTYKTLNCIGLLIHKSVPDYQLKCKLCLNFFLFVDLAILGCHVYDRSMDIARRVSNDLRPELNISNEPILLNISPLKAKSYLMENPPRFCVLVVDAATVQDAYNQLPERRAEYDDLFKTAADRVCKLVIFPLLVPFEENTPKSRQAFRGTVTYWLARRTFHQKVAGSTQHSSILLCA